MPTMPNPVPVAASVPTAPAQPGFSHQMGMSSGPSFSDIGAGISQLGKSVAAGFARDPRVAARYGTELAYDERNRAEQLDRVTDGFRQLAQVAQSMPGKPMPAAMQKLAERQAELFVRLGGRAEEAQYLLGMISGFAQMPALESDTQRKVRELRENGVNVTPEMLQRIYGAGSPGAASGLGKLREDLDAGLISPEQYQAAVRMATTREAGQAPALSTITIKDPEGNVQTYDSRDPAAREAIQAGGIRVDYQYDPLLEGPDASAGAADTGAAETGGFSLWSPSTWGGGSNAEAAPVESAPMTPVPAGVPSPKSAAEYDAIPSGTKYQHPSDPPGTTRTKK